MGALRDIFSRSRWWLTASRSFAGLSFKGFRAAALLTVLTAVGLPIPHSILIACIVVLIVVGPFAVGAVAATLFERRNEAEKPLTPPERRRRLPARHLARC